MFHWRDGWFFERRTAKNGEELGVVRITKRESARPDALVIAQADIPAAEWASIVASVSVQGETGHTWRQAVAFHMGSEPLPKSD